MLVALPKPGDECYDRDQRQARRCPYVRIDGTVKVNAAYHEPVAHVLGEPCIKFAPKPRWVGYLLVHERNVVVVLVHESMHCAIQRIFDLDDSAAVNRGFDRIFWGVEKSRELMPE